MKQLLLFLLILSLTGCAAPVPPEPDPPAVEVMAVTPEPEVKPQYLGIAAVASISDSMHATYDFPGAAHTEVTVAAVVLDDNGVIRQCCIDGISADIPFDATGSLQLEEGTRFASKAELGRDYGMHKASPLGTDWHQQSAAFAADCVGKTLEQLMPGDTVTSVTISTDALLQAVYRAAKNARAQEIGEGDRLTLTCYGVMKPSCSARIDDGSAGLACFRAAAGAFVLQNNTVVAESCTALNSAIPFSAEGRIDCDLSTALSPLSPVLTPDQPAVHECNTLKAMATA